MKKEKTNSIKVLIIILIYRILLDITIATVIKDKFTYALGTIEFSVNRFFISTIILLLFSKGISKLINNYSIANSMVLVLFFIYYIPSWVFFSWYNEVPNKYAIALLIHSSLLMLFNNIIPKFKISIKRNKISDFQFNIIVWTIILSAIFVTGYYNGFNLHFSLDDVYELRAEMLNASLPTIVRYIQPIGRYINTIFYYILFR